MMNTKGYIFDFGGTLDTAGCHWGKVLWHAYEAAGVPVDEQQFRQAYVYAERFLGAHSVILPNFSFRQMLDAKLALELDFLSSQKLLPMHADALHSLRCRLTDSLYQQVSQTIARSREVLASLHRSFPLALVSNFYGNMPVVLREFRLDDLFLAVIESAVVGVRKPDERIFQLGVEALQLKPEEVAVVGDSYEKDILPAHRLGCQTVWLKGEGWTDKQFNESLPDKIIGSLEELLQ